MEVSRSGSTDSMSTEKFEKRGSPRYWVLCVLSILIGRWVEVYLKDESIICGIFWGADTKKLSGIVLKKAEITSTKESVSYTNRKPQTMIINTADIVSILAKDCKKELMVALDQHRDREDISVTEDCALYDKSKSPLACNHKNKTEKAAPHNFQLSSTSSSVVLKEPSPSEYDAL